MKIAIIGNCQFLSLLIYIKKLISQYKLDITAKWVCYSKTFEPHIGSWALSVKDDMILNTSSGIKYINDCDFIIYQHITKETSEYFNATNLKKITNNNCNHTCSN